MMVSICSDFKMYVDNSFGNSLEFTQSNVFGTHVLLESAKAAGIKRFLHVSTDEVKGETMTDDEQLCNGFDRPDLDPTNPYAATKAAAELIVKSYYRSFQLPVVITRSNNVYGPGQFPEKIIPKFILLLNQGKQCFIHGDGSNKRTYIYVKDVARAFDIILHKGHVGNTYNIATDVERSNLQVAQTLIRMLELSEKEKELLVFVQDRLFNDRRYYIDPSTTLVLGWRPQIEWDKGLQKTIKWYTDKKNQEKWMISVGNVLVPHPRIGPSPTMSSL